MKELFKHNAVFITLSLILLVVLGLALLWVPKGELHLLLCDRHTPARDIFYRYYTRGAEWLPYVVCVCIFLFGRIGNAALATACIACSELTTQVLKHIVRAPRPITWFAANMPDIQLPLTEGVNLHQWLSFPSGHTTTFFALFFALSILLTRTTRMTRMTGYFIQLLLFAAATIGAYSRIYLSQHFAADVFGGMVVGLLISSLCYLLFSRFMDRKWYNYRLFAKK